MIERSQLVTALREAQDDDWDYGWRYVDGPASVGDTFEASHDRADDGESLGELSGTSAFASVDDLLAYVRWTTTGSVVLLRGVRVASGDLAGEIVMDDATVVRAWTL